MRHSFRILISGLIMSCFLLPACKKNKKDTPPGEETTIEKVVDMISIQQNACVKYEETWNNSHDSLEALIEMAKWIKGQESVEKVGIVDGYRVNIYFKSGLQTSITLITNINGEDQIRGGGGKAEFTGVSLGRSSAEQHLIGNTKAIVICPFTKEFYGGSIYPYKDKLENGGDYKLTADIFLDAAANVSVLDKLKDYGLIIIDSHGSTDQFKLATGIAELDLPQSPTGGLLSGDKIRTLISDALHVPLESISYGELRIGYNIRQKKEGGEVVVFADVEVTENYIRKLPNLTDAVVFGNYCFSGHTFAGTNRWNMMEAFKSIGAISYYGYAFADGRSMLVDNHFCLRMEDSLISNLTRGDSTGIAHLKNDVTQQFQTEWAVGAWQGMGNNEIDVTLDLTTLKYATMVPTYNGGPFYFTHFIDPTYKYGCGTFTDPRDGEVYKLACIGDQKWFAENLRYNASGSLAYDNNEANVSQYGRLYNYSTVSAGQGIGPITGQGLQGICPNGWHIPNKAEMDELMTTLNNYGSISDRGKMLKANVLWDGEDAQDLQDPLRNIIGFNALPAGKAVNNTGISFYYKGEQTNFWGSSPGPNAPNSTTSVINMYISNVSMILGDITVTGNQDYYSCRCVQNQ